MNNDLRTFLMMGRPGCGKGTQAALLSEALGARVYSSGLALRNVAKRDTFLGKKVKSVIDSGQLLPAWYSSFLFVQTLLDLEPTQKIIFEGACRTLPEAEAFDETAAWLERPYRAIYLDISDAEVERRLTLRKNVEGRTDDASDTVSHRIVEYKEKTEPAVEFFKTRGTLIRINGEQSVEAVKQDILNALHTVV